MLYEVITENSSLTVTADGKTIFKKKYSILRPPEMEAVEIELSGEDEIKFGLE